MAGLAYGCGDGRASCGVLTGGCCLLALYAAKGGNGEEQSEQLPLLLSELSTWFEGQIGTPFGGIACETITGDKGPAAARQRCAAIVADTFAHALAILVSHGFDPYDSL